MFNGQKRCKRNTKAQARPDMAPIERSALDPAGEWSEDWAEVWIETGAGQPLPPAEDGTPHPLAARRKETDQRVLANLLRLNLERAAGRAITPTNPA